MTTERFTIYAEDGEYGEQAADAAQALQQFRLRRPDIFVSAVVADGMRPRLILEDPGHGEPHADLADAMAEAISCAIQGGLAPEVIRLSFADTLALHTGMTPAAPEVLAPWCRTCGNEVDPTSRKCGCWGFVAEALQRFLGRDFDAAAAEAATLWEDTDPADLARVHAAEYAETHDVDIYPDMRRYAPADVREADKAAFPHDEDCPVCGRRQWGLGPDVTDPMNPSDDEQETCGACGFTFEGQQ